MAQDEFIAAVTRKQATSGPAIRRILAGVLNDREPDAEKNTPEVEWRRVRNIFAALQTIREVLTLLSYQVDQQNGTDQEIDKFIKDVRSKLEVIDPGDNFGIGRNNTGRGGSGSRTGSPGGGNGFAPALIMLLEMAADARMTSEDNSGMIQLLRGALHAVGEDLTRVGTGLSAAIAAGDALAIPKSLIDAKGDLIVGLSDNTPTRIAVGGDGQVLTADSAQSTGVKWAAAAGGSGGDQYAWNGV